MNPSRSLPAKLVLTAAAALCGCAVGLLVGSAGAAGTAALTVIYTSPTTLQLKLDDGTVVKSGGVVPAGSYMVDVFDDSEVANPKFTLNGPGVAISSDLNSTGMGIDSPSMFGPYTFQTSSSYTVADGTMGASAAINFTTSATATATGSSSTQPTTTISTNACQGCSHPTAPVNVMKGTIKATLVASGKLKLTIGGKTIGELASGRYKVTVSDRSRKAGVTVRKLGTRAVKTLSGVKTTGTRTVDVTLGSGKWYFAAAGRKTWFTVTG